MCAGSKGAGWDPAFAKLMGTAAKRQKLDPSPPASLPLNGMPMFFPSTVHLQLETGFVTVSTALSFCWLVFPAVEQTMSRISLFAAGTAAIETEIAPAQMASIGSLSLRVAVGRVRSHRVQNTSDTAIATARHHGYQSSQPH